MQPIRTLIMGAAGRDFHNFNVLFRDDSTHEIVAFTATQIPDIEGRRYPPELAGERYPEGIPIVSEADLLDLIREKNIAEVVFSYSDISHDALMDKASRVLAAGAHFRMLGLAPTAIRSIKPIISICAVRTGVGKSQTTRHVVRILRDMGKRTAVVRHPMPYGDLAAQAVQRFATYDDLTHHKCTIEEREEYEPHIDNGAVVFAGVDYEKILRAAEAEADVVLWDGGNNDLPFFRPDLHIVLADPHRPGHEARYYPGAANVYSADVLLINKVDTADAEDVLTVRENLRRMNPKAIVVDGASPLFVDEPDRIRGKRVLVIEDGPTLTHGEMTYGAGWVAARRFGAAEIVDPRPFAVRSLADTYAKYPGTGPVLPAMGYGDAMVRDLEETIDRTDCDLVVSATPIDLTRILKVKKPMLRVRYELQVLGEPTLADIVRDRLEKS